MATKAELEAELAALRAELADRSKTASDAGAGDAEPASSSSGDRDPSALDRLLAEHGIEDIDTAKLLEQLSDELGGLPQNKPILTALAAFVLGFAFGRLSK